jgi:hypothetical protein
MNFLSKRVKLQRIAIVTCYFGKWPWYFPYFLHSCKFNPTIDFIIITDNIDFVLNKPPNVKIINKSLNEIISSASSKLKLKVSIDDPYKLCDFKPAYGFLFSQMLEVYDFWGHGDIDVIYGNIRSFLTHEILTEYELITARHDFLSGTFTLFRNNDKLNTLFMESKDYKKVFSQPRHFCFDECNFLWKQIGELKPHETIFDLPCEIESMTHVVRSLQAKSKIKAFFDFLIVEGLPGNLQWVEGKVIFKNEFEALLYHLIKFKKENKPSKLCYPLPSQFNISPRKIYCKSFK